MMIIFYLKAISKYCLLRGYLLVLRPFLSKGRKFRKEVFVSNVSKRNNDSVLAVLRKNGLMVGLTA